MVGKRLTPRGNEAGRCVCSNWLKTHIIGDRERICLKPRDCKEIMHLGGILDAIFLKMGGLAIPNLFVTYLK